MQTPVRNRLFKEQNLVKEGPVKAKFILLSEEEDLNKDTLIEEDLDEDEEIDIDGDSDSDADENTDEKFSHKNKLKTIESEDERLSSAQPTKRKNMPIANQNFNKKNESDNISGQLFKLHSTRNQKGNHSPRSKMPFFMFQPSTNIENSKRKLLPTIHPTRLYTLVLDLDETLIHFEDLGKGKSRFLIRPYAKQFLKNVSEYYEVVIFTAAKKEYADFILDKMDPKKCVTHRLYRNHTNLVCNVYQKDLSKLGRPLSKVLIVDNKTENFQLQPDNGIYIKSWYGDSKDTALQELSPILISKQSKLTPDIVKEGHSDVRIAMEEIKQQMIEEYGIESEGELVKMSLEI